MRMPRISWLISMILKSESAGKLEVKFYFYALTQNPNMAVYNGEKYLCYYQIIKFLLSAAGHALFS
jgi:hypothetical protein